MNTPQCTTCRDMQCKGGFYCLVNIEKAAHIANMMQLEGVDYTRGYKDGARIHQNAYEDGYKAATSTESLRCKFHCEQAVQEFRDRVLETLHIYSVTAPEKSRAATFTPEQFMRVIDIINSKEV